MAHQPEPIIVYEDDDVLVIDKPAGLLTHRVSKTDASPTVVSWLLQRYPEIAEVYDHGGQDLSRTKPAPSIGGQRNGLVRDVEWESMRSGIVHRLDKDTSGLLVIAKTQSALHYLKGLFKERQIKKTYIALVHGHLKEKSGMIEAPIGKYGGKQTTRTVVGRSFLKEKPAITDYRVLEEFRDFSLLELQPRTGRTHQLRVHLKSIGHPIVCDPLYGNKKLVCSPELGRLFLHAQKLQLVTPTGESLTLEADLPSELASFLQILPKV